MGDHEVEDIYASAWAAILSALRTRGRAMKDDELRAYILTAVASHASKEMRRRSRKPAGPISTEAEQVLTDGHLPLPEEIVIGSESRSIARDLLTSLPQRRRAVMLLRYGWGMSPAEVCALVPGLSPRAYRKEITKGVEQLIERLRLVEDGAWCKAREPLVRDLVAGTADENSRREAVEHLEHCRSCSELAARLSGQLHDLGGVVALGAVAAAIGGAKPSIVDRFADLVEGGREAVADFLERGQLALATVTNTGAGRGGGAAGAGVVAKVAGAGGAGKAVIACLGAGAAATACVAAGVVPGVSFRDPSREVRDQREPTPAIAIPATSNPGPHKAMTSVTAMGRVIVAGDQHAPGSSNQATAPAGGNHGAEPPTPTVIPPRTEEFDPVASQAAPLSTTSGSGNSTNSGNQASAGSVAQNEFGP